MLKIIARLCRSEILDSEQTALLDTTKGEIQILKSQTNTMLKAYKRLNVFFPRIFLYFTCFFSPKFIDLILQKLDGVGPIDNRLCPD